MEEKAASSEDLPGTSAPPHLNLPAEERMEANNDSCNFENLITDRRMHDDDSTNGDLHCKRLTTRCPSYSDFTGNSPRETQSDRYQKSVQNTSEVCQLYNRGVTGIDDGTVGSGFQFGGMQMLRIGDAHKPTGFTDCNQGEPMNSNMASNVFQRASLPTYPQIPVTSSGTMGGKFQFGKSCGPMHGRKDLGLRENRHVQFGYNSQGDDMNNNTMRNTLQLANLHSSQTSAALHLCTSLSNEFQSNDRIQNFVSLNQSSDHHHHPAYGGSFNFGNRNNAASLVQSGNQDSQAFNFGQKQHSVIPWINSEPHPSLVSNVNGGNDVCCTGRGGHSHLSMLSGMPIGGYNPGENKNHNVPYIGPGLLMHVRSMNPTATPNNMQNYPPVYDQNALQIMQNCGSDYHPASSWTLDDVHKMTVYGLARPSRMSGSSVSAANIPPQLFFSPVQRVHQNNMRTSVVNPSIAQMTGQHSLCGQNMRNPSGMNFGNTSNYYVAGQHAANYSQGYFASLANQGAIIQGSKHLQANKETLLQPSSEGLPHNPALTLFLPSSGSLPHVPALGGGRIVQDAGETQTKMVKLARPSSKHFLPVISQGLGDRSLALQEATCTDVQASNVAVVNSIVQASGDGSHIAQSAQCAHSLSNREAFVQAGKRAVAQDPVPGKALAETLLKSSKSLCALVPFRSVQKRAAIPGYKNMKPTASIFRQPDIIHRSSGEDRGSSCLTPLGARCGLCNIDLAFPAAAMGAAAGSGDNPPVSAVLPCGHCFHDSCLRKVGVSTEASEEPHCVACGFTQDRNVG